MTRIHAFRSVLLIAVLLAAGGTAPAWAIEGGAPARAGDQLARATVAVGTVNHATGRLALNHCSGVLIEPDLVLTAAHCVRNDPVAAAVLLYDGSKAVRRPQWVRTVATTAIDPADLPADDLLGAIDNLSLDIAVLRLSSPVRGRRPLALVRNPQRLPATLRLAGVGWTGRDRGTLKTARLKPVLITDSGITVARATDARVCVGDSGGPVVVPGPHGPLLWGVASAIISRSQPCGHLVVIAPAGLGRLPPS